MAHDIQKCARTKDVLSNIDILFENDVLIEKVIRKGLLENGFTKESPIQMAAFPYVLNSYDAIVQSKSGTGKSIVFVVAALNKLVRLPVQQPQTIILAPTREIAVQITDVVRSVGKYVPNLHVDYFIGGTQVERPKRPVQIVVGSPGRIKQLIKLKYMSVDAVRLFILDEADKLINRGFVEDITWIYSQLPSMKQMLVVSATYSQENLNTLSRYMVDPMFIRPEDASRPLLGVKQLVALIPVECKNPNLRHVDEEKKLVQLLSHIPFTQCVIFSNYQLRPDVICENLAQTKFGSVFLSGAQEQSARLASLESFKRGQVRILVTTDLAARGIDAANVDLVINLEVPHDAATYLHRMGRAGRYGTRGLVITIVSMQSLVKFHSLMAEINLDHEFNVGLLPDKLGESENWLQRVEIMKNLGGEKQVAPVKTGENPVEKEAGKDALEENEKEVEDGEKKDVEEKEVGVLKSCEEKKEESLKTVQKEVTEKEGHGGQEDKPNETEGDDSGKSSQEDERSRSDALTVNKLHGEVRETREVVDESDVIENSNEDNANYTKLNESSVKPVETKNKIKTIHEEGVKGGSVSTSADKLKPVDFDYLNEFINSLGSKDASNDSPNSTKFIEIKSDDGYLIQNMKACIDNDVIKLKSLMKKLDHIDSDTLSDWILNKHSNVAALFKNQDANNEAVSDETSGGNDRVNNGSEYKNTNEKAMPPREIQSYDSLAMFSPCQTTLNKHDIEAEQTVEPKKNKRRNRNKKNNKENKNILNTPTKNSKASDGPERTPDRSNRNNPSRDDLNATGDRSFLKGSKLPQRDLVVYDEIDIFSPAANNLDEYEIDYINQDDDSCMRKVSSQESLHHNDSLDIKLRKKLKAGNRLQRNQRRQSKHSDAAPSVDLNNKSSFKLSSGHDDGTPVMKVNGHGPTRPSRKLSHDDTDFQISWEDNARATNDKPNFNGNHKPSTQSGRQSNAEKRSVKYVEKTSANADNGAAMNSMNQAYEANFSKLELSAYNDENAVFLPNSSSDDDDTETNEANPNSDDSETDSNKDPAEGNPDAEHAVYNESSLNSSCIDLICDDLDEQYARDFSMYRDSSQYGTPSQPDALHFKSWIKNMELYNVSTNVNVSDDDGLDDSYNMLKTPTPVKRRQKNCRLMDRENPSNEQRSVGRKVDGKILLNPLLRRALVNKQNQVNMWNQENHGATYSPLESPFVSNFSNSFNFETDFSNIPHWAKQTRNRRAPVTSHANHNGNGYHQHQGNCESEFLNRSKRCALPAMHASSPHNARKHYVASGKSNHSHQIRSIDKCSRVKKGSKCIHGNPTYGSQFDPNLHSRKSVGNGSKKHRRRPTNVLPGVYGDSVNATFGDFGDYTYSELNELGDYDVTKTERDDPDLPSEDEDYFDSEENEDLGEEQDDLDNSDLLDSNGNPSDEANYRKHSTCGNSSTQSGSPQQSGSPHQSGQSSYKSISLESYSVIDNPSLDVSWQSASSQVDNSDKNQRNSGGQEKSTRRNGQKSRDGVDEKGSSPFKAARKGRPNQVVRSRSVNYNPYDAAMPGAWQSVPIEVLETEYNPDQTVYFSEEAVEQKIESRRDEHKGRDARGESMRDKQDYTFRPIEKMQGSQSRQKANQSASVLLGQDRTRHSRKHATRNFNSEDHRRRRRNESFGNETFDIVDELEGLKLEDNRRRSRRGITRNNKGRTTDPNVQQSSQRRHGRDKNHRSSQHGCHRNDAESRFHGNSSSSTRTCDLYLGSGHSQELYWEDESDDCDDACHCENGLVNGEQPCPYENVLRAHPAYYPGLDIENMRRGMDRQRAFMERYMTQFHLYMNVARNVANTPCFNF